MPAGTPATGSPVRVESNRRVILILPAAMLLAAVSLTGCTSEEPVVVETVPKDAPAEIAAPRLAARTDRMLAAIIPQADRAVFFKMTGPEQAVAEQMAAFLELVKSVTFEDGVPTWTLPADWTQQEGSGERLATIDVSGEPPLEVSVTALPMRGSGDEYRLANVNRWRGQMGLAPIEASDLHAGGDLDDETVELTLADGTKATLVNLVGGFASGGMTPPFAGGEFAGSARRDTAPAEPAGLAYDVPSGWRDVGADGISKATLLVEGAKTTVTDLPASANALLPNVNRWRGQVGLPPIAEGQLDEAVETVMLGDGEEASYVELVGPGDRGTRQAILGVVAVRDDAAWFVKMIGDAEAVLREKSNFESFVKSLRFSGGE